MVCSEILEWYNDCGMEKLLSLFFQFVLYNIKVSSAGIIWFKHFHFMFPSQVNGIDVQGLRHAQVVELIHAAGNEVRLLVVDPETDELYLNLGLMATTSSHDKGKNSGKMQKAWSCACCGRGGR